MTQGREDNRKGPGADVPPQAGDLLFLYGSLRRGRPAARALGLDRASVHAGAASMAGVLYDLGDYPGLVLSGRGLAHGEVRRVADPRLFAALDRYECYVPEDPLSLFVRVRAPLAGRRDTAWVYVYNRPVAGRGAIASGVWKR